MRDVTTVITDLLPRRTTTNAGELGPEIPRSIALLLAVVITISSWWSVGTTFAIALRSASGGRPSWADGLFVGGRDNFTWKVQPNRIHKRQMI